MAHDSCFVLIAQCGLLSGRVLPRQELHAVATTPHAEAGPGRM